MAYKVLASAITNPSSDKIDRATAVAVTVSTSPATLTLANTGGTIGTISLAVGIHKILKEPDDTISVTGSATKIAHTD